MLSCLHHAIVLASCYRVCMMHDASHSHLTVDKTVDKQHYCLVEYRNTAAQYRHRLGLCTNINITAYHASNVAHPFGQTDVLYYN